MKQLMKTKLYIFYSKIDKNWQILSYVIFLIFHQIRLDTTNIADHLDPPKICHSFTALLCMTESCLACTDAAGFRARGGS